jgi:hypothetical protein
MPFAYLRFIKIFLQEFKRVFFLFLGHIPNLRLFINTNKGGFILEEKELKCKLEQMAAGMGYEVKKKFKKEMDPIYKLFQILIIFGFLTVFTIMGTYLTISLNKKEIIYVDKIVYVDKPIITEKVVYVNKYIDKIIEKEKIVYKTKYRKISKTKGLKYQKTVIRNGREYKYYKKTTGDIWEFYTIAPKVKTCQK